MKVVILGEDLPQTMIFFNEINTSISEIDIIKSRNLKELNLALEEDKSILIIYLNSLTLKESLSKNYCKIINIIKYDDSLNIKEIIKRYLILYNLNKILLEKDFNIKNIILFGSLPTLKVTEKSDVDLYIVTDKFNLIYNFLKKIKLNKFGKLKNKIYFYIENILIELNIVKNINEILSSPLCYNGNILDSKSDIFDNEKRYVILYGDNCSKILNLKKNYNVNIKECFEEFWYYYYSLENLKGDIYKFDFHWFILRHNYIRIKSYLKNKSNYNYLPKNSYSLLSKTERDILFSKELSLSKRILNLKEILEKIKKYQEKLNV